MGMGKNPETRKLSMTLTYDSIEWLNEQYPEAQSTQEAVRMAVSDARKHCHVVEQVEYLSESD